MKTLLLDPMDVLFTLRDRTLRQSAIEKLRQKQQTIGFQTLVLTAIEGGVGYRYWQETGEFGNPERYLTQQETQELFDDYASNLATQLAIPVQFYCAFAYQAKSTGNWGPIPENCLNQPEWSSEWRMPNTGMLEAILKELNCNPEDVLLVSEFDYAQQAAQTIGIPFAWGKDFFLHTQPASPPLPEHSQLPEPSQQAFWGVVEIMGHVTEAGRISQETFAGKGFFRIDTPVEGGMTTQYVSPNSIYRFTPTTEALAREVARREQSKPHWAMGINIIPARSQPPQTPTLPPPPEPPPSSYYEDYHNEYYEDEYDDY